MAAAPRRTGFTLLELMITLAIAAVLGAVATPPLGALLERQRLQAAGHFLLADIAQARHEAARRGQAVHLRFEADQPGRPGQPGLPWCYSLATDPATDCRQPDPAMGRIKQVSGSARPGIHLLQSGTMTLAPDGSSGWQPQQHRDQAVFSARDGQQLQVRLGALGRASLCAPAAPLPGTPPCPAEPPPS